MFLLQNGSKLDQCPTEARGDRAHGEPKHPGDLLDREVEPVTENDDGPLRGTERGDGVGDRPEAEIVLRRVAQRPAVQSSSLVVEQGQPASAAKMVDGTMTTIRLSQGPNGRVSSKRSSAPNAF